MNNYNYAAPGKLKRIDKIRVLEQDLAYNNIHINRSLIVKLWSQRVKTEKHVNSSRIDYVRARLRLLKKKNIS